MTQSTYIPVEHLQPGLYIDLELNWTEHPFLFRSFTLKNDAEIDQIKKLGLRKVKVLVHKSSGKVVKAVLEKGNKVPEREQVATLLDSDDEVDEVLSELWQEKKRSLDKARDFRRERIKTEQQYHETQKRVNTLIRDLKSAPANAVRDASEVIEHISAQVEEEPSIVVSLVSLTNNEFTASSHAINVTILTMALAKSLGLPARDISLVGLASILHDVGKALLPPAVTDKKTPLTEAEEKIMETHVEKGAFLLEHLNIVPEEVVNMIAHHHVFLDGTGYPESATNAELSHLTRILQVANQYDTLCNPHHETESQSPKTAMANLYSNFKGKLDNTYVQLFVRNFGVYPPGTIVLLSDESIALVSACNSDDLLNPTVIIFNPDIPAKQALMLNLAEYPELSITKALNRNEYTQEIKDYLGGDFRIGLFFSQSTS
ncbi:HD-GYP domain-containing protein [Reinekea marinisedimentorum]|uniref:Putative nucleotidyltransferase with HDIG domain n=1 Tax=Reinekea marinisedimentorum TaxID=230495 RepID=A0A4R3I014_9GAMM|nr:HD domain-containing phosphohydrolase [Reinekea marinisedimentorum]TCS37129.1 putative nucleotidyltransferase with HDIG domain [Reinekea marinisedimentorum]